MTTLYLFTCPAGNGTTIANQPNGLTPDGRLVPHCPGGGTWVQVESGSISFDLAAWLAADPANQLEFGAYFAAGFIIVGMAHCIGWGVRALLSLF